MAPLVVAHRGASHGVAEHTLGAYLEALDVGADGLECDVRLTADGHLVCYHDRSLWRTGSTRSVLSTMDLADLDQLEFASWKNPWADLDDEAPVRDTQLDRMLTLRKLLETVADCGRRVELAIETKHPTRYAGLVERRLVEELRRFGWDRPDSPVRVMSFSYVALQRVERLAPGLRLVMLIDRARHWPVLKPVLGRTWELGPGIDQLTRHPQFARRMQRSGRRLNVWTVNDDAQLQLCLDLGVTTLITDRPAYLLEQLGR
ncbi:glycerophosphodiester phosphodiesterase family protein [Nocardioides coralli]|uniref:glycerophosphodiester phosphodiesterase family protein n=1 Tax=Nocardioides coralli TaxID=2872154 RepID=UPI001CA3EB57|nr:glycerophosphodiester phosphodiesterase family protein [Nocardioides coralli]QZY29258.1 glycerophosphodiester phosphodiesterase [Nocardioides coralli]